MPDKPETLAETQARLSGMNPGDPLPPPVSVPESAAATRPDPYAASQLAQPDAQPFAFPAPAPAASRRPINVIAIVAGVVALVVVAAVVAFNALADPIAGSLQPVDEPVGDPVYSEQWQQFPGVSYIDPSETLAQPSYEDAVAATEALVTQYREQLTAEFGFTWSKIYEGGSDLESNGYGGDSMLYYVDSGTWQGQVQLDDPAARQRILDIFTAISAQNGGDGVLLRNDFYSDDEASAREQFGAVQLSDQALWSFSDSYPALAGGYLSSDVIDRSIPVDDSFTGDYMFTYNESTDTLYVSIYGYLSALLKEADRADFEAALEPYHGDYQP